MLNSIFDPDNLIWRMISRMVDFVGLSLLWAALCIPVITAGPATAALYYTTVKAFRQQEDRTFRVFIREFRANLRVGIPYGLISAALLFAIAAGYRIMALHTDTGFGAVMFMAYYVALIIPVGWVLYLFPMMGRFRQDSKMLWMNALLLCLKHLPSTIILVLLNVQLCIFTLEKWYPILFAPTLAAFLSSLFLEKIFLKHVSEEDQAALKNMTVEELEAEKTKKKKSSEETSDSEETTDSEETLD